MRQGLTISDVGKLGAIAACEVLDEKGIPFPSEMNAMLDMIVEIVDEANAANSKAKMLLN